MANELAKRRDTQMDTVRGLLAKNQNAFREALPKHMDAGRFMRVALTLISRNPRLQDCTTASLAGSMLQSAQLGLDLDPNLGKAWLVPYRDNKAGVTICQFQVGYKGLAELVLRGGSVVSLEMEVVHEKDTFEEVLGTERKLVHKRFLGEDAGPVVGAYATAVMANGTSKFKFMPIHEIEAIRKRSKAKDDGPWKTDYEAMCKKTALKQLTKLLPLTVEAAKAVAVDDAAEAGLQMPELEGLTAESLEDAKQADVRKRLDAAKKKGDPAPDYRPPVEHPPTEREPPKEPPKDTGEEDLTWITYAEAVKVLGVGPLKQAVDSGFVRRVQNEGPGGPFVFCLEDIETIKAEKGPEEAAPPPQD